MWSPGSRSVSCLWLLEVIKTKTSPSYHQFSASSALTHCLPLDWFLILPLASFMVNGMDPLPWSHFTCFRSEGDYAFFPPSFFIENQCVSGIMWQGMGERKSLWSRKGGKPHEKKIFLNLHFNIFFNLHFNKYKGLMKNRFQYQNAKEKMAFPWRLPIRKRHLNWTLKNRKDTEQKVNHEQQHRRGKEKFTRVPAQAL